MNLGTCLYNVPCLISSKKRIDGYQGLGDGGAGCNILPIILEKAAREGAACKAYAVSGLCRFRLPSTKNNIVKFNSAFEAFLFIENSIQVPLGQDAGSTVNKRSTDAFEEGPRHVEADRCFPLEGSSNVDAGQWETNCGLNRKN